MTPYVKGLISGEDLKTFLKIKEVVEKLPDLKPESQENDPEYDDEIISCHMLVRALKPFFPVKVCDGYFCGGYQHSWLITASGHTIDVYPVATLGGPILIEGSFCSPARKLYRRNNKRYNGRFSKPKFRSGVELLRNEIRKILSNSELC